MRRFAHRRDVRADAGSALVEFVWLAVLLMVPLVYVVITAAEVQRTAFGLTAAARDAGRAYATAGSDDAGEARAEQAVALDLHDQGVSWHAAGRIVSCGDCSYAPGSTFTIDLHARVVLPMVPHWLCGDRCLAGIPLTATHTERISCYAGTGTPQAGAAC